MKNKISPISFLRVALPLALLAGILAAAAGPAAQGPVSRTAAAPGARARKMLAARVAQRPGTVVRRSHSAMRPNIIYILADDLGYGDVGAFYQDSRPPGAPRLLTPSLDRMAAGGMMWTDHYSSAPVCAPSRASLMRGVDQGHAAVRNNQFDKPIPPSPTLGSVLKTAGYYTAAIGKWGLGGTAPPWPGHPQNRGFDEFYGFMRHEAAHHHYAGDNNGIFDGFHEVSQGLTGVYDTDLYTARAKRSIVQHVTAHPGQPFFLYLAYTLPHFGMELPPGPYPAGGGLHGGVQWPVDGAAGTPNSYVYPEFRNKPWPAKEKCFASMVRRLDDGVGDVLQLVHDLHLDKNTLVIFSSDNGPHNEGNDPAFFSSWGPFDGFKRDLFEGGSREPTIAWWPGVVPAGTVSHEISAQYDWLATLCDAAGLVPPASTDGISLLPTLTGHPQQQRHHPYLYFEYEGPMTGFRAKEVVERHGYEKRGQMQAVRVGAFVGVRYDIKSPEDPLQLYRVTADPHQDHNLAGDPQYAPLLKQMRGLLVTARTVNPSAPRPYDHELMPAVPAPGTTGGLAFRLYDGSWPWLPDFRTLEPARTGIVRGFALPPARADERFGVEFVGYVKVPSDGEYTFTERSDSGAVLRVHDSLVIDDDTMHDGTARSGSVRLQAGWHPIRLDYRRATGAAPLLSVTLRQPGSPDDRPIEAAMLGYDRVR